MLLVEINIYILYISQSKKNSHATVKIKQTTSSDSDQNFKQKAPNKD